VLSFLEWEQLTEDTIEDLKANIERGFPRTTKRQYSTDPVTIIQAAWYPYVGTKTLLVRGLADSEESGKEYVCAVLFKQVQFGDDGDVTITANNGEEYTFTHLDPSVNDIAVRCQCPDFRWRFAWYNKPTKALFGPLPSPYQSKGLRPPVNPMQVPGMCKHLLKLMIALQGSGALVT
jgi:hypothetical protein